MPVKPKIYDDSVFTQDTAVKKPAKVYDDSIFTGEVKKKEAGGAELKHPSPSALASGSVSAPIATPINDETIYSLAKERKDLLNATSGEGSIEYKGLGTTELNKKNKDRITEIDAQLRNSGYDPDEITETFSDIPYLPSFGAKNALQLKKDNPDYFNRKKAAIKYQSALVNAKRNKEGTEAAGKLLDEMYNLQFSTDYDSQRQNTRYLIGKVYENIDDVSQQHKLINDIVKDRMYGYGLDLEGKEQAIGNDPRLKLLNNDQITALQFLEDVDPETAKSFNRLLSLSPQEIEQANRSTPFRLGYQSKAKELEDIGMNIRQRALEEKMSDFVNKNKKQPLTPDEQAQYDKLYAERQEVLQLRDQQKDKYPLAVAADADKLMQDYLGARHGTLAKTLLGIGENADDLVNFVTDAIPFDGKDARIDDLEKFGSKQLGQLSQYDTKEEELFGRAYLPVFSGELKTKIDTIKNDKTLSSEQREDAVRKAIFEDNYKNLSYISNDKSGKFNFTGKAILNSISNVASEIVPQIFLSYVTAGGANATKLGQLSSLFGNTFAMAYNDYYTDAIGKNLPNPHEYAILHTTVEAATEMIGDNVEQAKRLFAGTTAGKILGQATDEEIKAIMNASKGKFTKFFDAVGATAKVAEKNARVEAFEELAGGLGNNAIDKYLFNKDVALQNGTMQDFVTTYVGMLPLGILGLPFHYKGTSMLQKRAIYEAASNPAKYFEKIDNQIENKELNAHDGLQIKQRIQNAYDILKNMNVQKKDGTLMTDDEKTNYLFNQVVQKDIEDNIEKAPEEKKGLAEAISNKLDQENQKLFNTKTNEKTEKAEGLSEVTTQGAETTAPLPDRGKILESAKPVIENAIKSGELKGQQSVIAQMVVDKNDPKEVEQYLKEVSDQALNKIAPDAVKEETDSYKAAVNNYGKEVVDLATQLFPLEKTTENDSKNQQGVHSTLGEGETPIKTESNKGASAAEVSTSGVFQTQKEIAYDDFKNHAIEMVSTVKAGERGTNWIIDLPGMTQADREGAIADIKVGKKTKRAERFEKAVQDMYDKGVVSVARGFGNHAESVDIPIKDWFSLDTNEQNAAAAMDDFTASIINDNDISLENIDQLKHLFDGFPYSQEDFSAVKAHLERESAGHEQAQKSGTKSQRIKEEIEHPEDTRTPEQIATAEKEYSDNEKGVREYVKDAGIDLTEDQVDLATSLIDPFISAKEAVDHVRKNLEPVNFKTASKFAEVEMAKTEKVKKKKKANLAPHELFVEDNYDNIVKDLQSKNLLKIDCS